MRLRDYFKKKAEEVETPSADELSRVYEGEACPYCSGTELRLGKVHINTGTVVTRGYQVSCTTCLATGPLRENPTDAVALWNAKDE